MFDFYLSPKRFHIMSNFASMIFPFFSSRISLLVCIFAIFYRFVGDEEEEKTMQSKKRIQFFTFIFLAYSCFIVFDCRNRDEVTNAMTSKFIWFYCCFRAHRLASIPSQLNWIIVDDTSLSVRCFSLLFILFVAFLSHSLPLCVSSTGVFPRLSHVIKSIASSVQNSYDF